MSAYIIYERESGRIVSRYTVPDFADSQQTAPDGYALIKGVASRGTHVINGEFVTPEIPISDQKEIAKAKVNNLSSATILDRLPDWKQRNLTARAVDLIQQGITASTEMDSIRAQWQWVESVRAASNIATTAIDTASDQSGIDDAITQFKTALEGLCES